MVPDKLAAVTVVGGRGVERVLTLVATVVTMGTIANTMITHQMSELHVGVVVIS